MQIIEVIPLASLPPQVPQLLSYFHNIPLQKGSIVEVLIGNRRVMAAVVSSEPLENQKILLKKTGFQLKKISKIISETPLVSEVQFKMAGWLARSYFAPLGLCLKTVMPSFFLKVNYGFNNSVPSENLKLNNSILLSRAKNIIKNIESEITKIAKGKQILVLLPETSIAEYFHDHFVKSHKAVIVHGKIGLKKSRENHAKIANGEADIIIGTRQALFSPFSNLGLIILEDPANEAYKSDMSPKYHTADVAVKISEIYSCPIQLISQIPSIKYYQSEKDGLYKIKDSTDPVKASVSVIDMAEEIRSGNFAILSRSLRKHILESAENKKKILIFSSRKGYSTTLLCGNCGFVTKCPDCSVPLRLYGRKESELICHRCSFVQAVPEFCIKCNSHKIKSAGFPGSQKIEEEIEFILGGKKDNLPIFIVDSSLVKKAKEEEEIIKKIKESTSCICIATQMVFSHRYDLSFDTIGVPSADSLTTIPNYDSEEEVFYQFEKLLDFEPKQMLVQTYNPENALFKSIKSGYKEFYDNEMAIRRMFSYPPFSRLVKISYRNANSGKAGYEAKILSEKLKMAIAQKNLAKSVKIAGPSKSYIEKERGLFAYNVILKISSEQKPDEILRYVPSNWRIDIDPKSIL